MLANKFGLFRIHLGGLCEVAIPRECCIFYPHLSLQTVFPALKLTQNFIIWTFLFLENWQFNHKLGPINCCLYYRLCLKDYPYNRKNKKSRRTQKFHYPNSLVNWEKNWKCSLGLYPKNRIFHLENFWKSNIQKHQNVYVNLEKLESIA